MKNDEIKRVRAQRKWSLERMAREVGVSYTTIWRWESGRSRPTGLAVVALDRVLRAVPEPAVMESA